MNLPAYLQGNTLPRLADKSTEGMGIPLPPHISIRGNRFTLVDGAGQQRPVETTYLDVCVIDVSDKMCKLYYGKDYAPDSNDPPLCFSANGVGPSRDAIQPQSPTCMNCPNNVRGSAVSKLTGAAIKACRDEKWLAVLLPSVDIGFQFRITPGSFSNWRDYAEKFKGQQFDVRDVVTRLEFAPDANGVVTFTPSSFIDETMAQRRNTAIQSKQTDILVGRTDTPFSGQLLPAPAATAAAEQPLPPVGQTPPAKTRGRPKAQPAAPAAPTAPTAPANGPVAPFRPEPAPAFGAAPQGNSNAPFGVQANPPAPPSDIAGQMASFFKQ